VGTAFLRKPASNLPFKILISKKSRNQPGMLWCNKGRFLLRRRIMPARAEKVLQLWRRIYFSRGNRLQISIKERNNNLERALIPSNSEAIDFDLKKIPFSPTSRILLKTAFLGWLKVFGRLSFLQKRRWDFYWREKPHLGNFGRVCWNFRPRSREAG